MFGSSNTVLLEVGNCLISFLGSSAELFNRAMNTALYTNKILAKLSANLILLKGLKWIWY